MKKAELLAKVSEDAGISKTDAEAAVKSFCDALCGTLKSGEKFAIAGVGTFSVNHRAARDGRNPATGQPMKIAAKNVVKFKAGKALNELLN